MDYYVVSPALLIAIVAIVAIALAVAAWALLRNRRRHEDLRVAFGPEYDYTVERFGDPRRAERELIRRKRRVQKLHIRALTPDEHHRYSSAWMDTQKRFVDDPVAAIREGDILVKDLMATRGYPIADFEQRVADLSVDHANVVQHYRAARALASSNEQGNATTEDLRQALIHYRALFEDLLRTQGGKT